MTSDKESGLSAKNAIQNSASGKIGDLSSDEAGHGSGLEKFSAGEAYPAEGNGFSAGEAYPAEGDGFSAGEAYPAEGDGFSAGEAYPAEGDGFSAGEEEYVTVEEGSSALAEGKDEGADKWRRLYEQAKRELEDREELSHLNAEYPSISLYSGDSVRYEKFLRFRSLGLSVREAYFAVNSDGIRLGQSPATKKHISPLSPSAYSSARRISTEELRIAKELLGDGYSSDEIDSLYRRITKNQ